MTMQKQRDGGGERQELVTDVRGKEKCSYRKDLKEGNQKQRREDGGRRDRRQHRALELISQRYRKRQIYFIHLRQILLQTQVQKSWDAV